MKVVVLSDVLNDEYKGMILETAAKTGADLPAQLLMFSETSHFRRIADFGPRRIFSLHHMLPVILH